MHSELNKKLEEAGERGLSYCIWRYPGESTLNDLGPAPEKIWDGKLHQDETFIFAPFNRKRHPVLMLGNGGQLSGQNAPVPPVHIPKNHFISWSLKAIEAIRSGLFKKIVAARVQSENRNHFKPYQHFLALCEKYPEAFCYLWYSPSSGTWMGASPELLLERSENTIRTMALAGTRTGLGDPFGEKEMEEQGLVLNYLKKILEPWVTELEIVKQTLGRSGHLQHLKNELKGSLKDPKADLSGLINELHPTPAVAGIPKETAITFIEEEEGMDRTYYSGLLGTISDRHARLYVNLRCMQILQDTCYLYAGAGLTADSDPEKEWQETEEKVKVVSLL